MAREAGPRRGRTVVALVPGDRVSRGLLFSRGDAASDGLLLGGVLVVGGEGGVGGLQGVGRCCLVGFGFG